MRNSEFNRSALRRRGCQQAWKEHYRSVVARRVQLEIGWVALRAHPFQRMMSERDDRQKVSFPAFLTPAPLV